MNDRQKSIVGLFFAVAILCGAMIVLGNFLGATAGVALTNVGSEGIRIAISALVGALATLIGASK